MLFAVLFTDKTGQGAEVRRRHMPAHLAFLEENAPKIEAAGPLLGADGEIDGGLWLVEAENAGDVEALVHTDPFWPAGLRQSFRILVWRQVFAGGRRRI